jgi:hypothetical protein
LQFSQEAPRQQYLPALYKITLRETAARHASWLVENFLRIVKADLQNRETLLQVFFMQNGSPPPMHPGFRRVWIGWPAFWARGVKK